MNMLVTERDKRVVELVGRARVATARQVKIAEFGLGRRTRCSDRLQLMVENQWLDVIKVKPANQPHIYRLGKRSSNGHQYLRLLWGEKIFKSHMTRIWNLQHLLGITELRVRVIRACKDNSYQLLYWQRSEDLQPLFKQFTLIPDAYFVIQRLVDGDIKRSHYFLEYELSLKSNEVIREKLQGYYDLIASGQFAQLFGTDQSPDLIPRVLFIFAPFQNLSPKPRVLSGVKMAAELGADFSRFVTLGTLTETSPTDILSASIWHSNFTESPQPLLG